MSAIPHAPSALRFSAAVADGRVQPLPLARPLHQPFFLTALALLLTLGATWGATLLWRIGLGHSFTAAGIHEINAHGQAQIYGWVGLFIMGFAYTVFPRMWRSPAPSRTLAMFALGANVSGVLLNAIGMRLTGASDSAPFVALAGAAMIVLGVLVFASQIVNAFERRRVAVEPAFLFMLIAIAWFVLSTFFSAMHTWMTITAVDRNQLVEIVGMYQAALRDVQIHSMALTMILGVSLKIVPRMFGLPSISHRRAMIALTLITLGVAGETSFFIAYRWTDQPIFAGILYACWVMLAVGVGTVLLVWRPCLPLPRDDGRSGKFIRAAYMWLAASLIMLLLLPLYQAVIAVPFSHAYYGAVRHAITVGFVSLMIMGVAAKFVPALRGVAWRDLSGLWGPFILVNLGCLLRVTLQTATDVYPAAFSFVGVSGMLEVVGLTWWAFDLTRQMLRCTGTAEHATTGQRLDIVSLHIDSTPGHACPKQRMAGDTCACCFACARPGANAVHCEKREAAPMRPGESPTRTSGPATSEPQT
jgi:hypothetical protein